MSSDDKKPTAQPAATPPASTPPSQKQTAKPAAPVKNPLISRRAFVIGALGASALLTVASVSQSGAILGPLIPNPENPTVVANWKILNGAYLNTLSPGPSPQPTAATYDPTNYSSFFYFPYPVTDSPYYKNIIARLPDPLVNPYYANDQILQHVGAWNLTCVHLRCIVNPGYAGNFGSGEFRLQCPCHGSQYRLKDAVPVAGPAFDLGLLPLPKISLSVDATTGDITATSMDGTPGIGRND
jgi:Rieske Fe-S protein